MNITQAYKNSFLLLSFLLLLTLLPSCIVGPNYRRPCPRVPEAYAYAPNLSSQCTADLTYWWQVFQDDCLSSLIAQALCSNYDLRIAVERIEQLAASYCIARANLFPQFDVVSDTNRRHFSSNLEQFSFLPANELTLDFLRFGMEALWEIDLWGRLRRAKRAAYAEYEAQIEDARGVYLIVVSDVATAYIDLRTLEKKIQLLKDRIAADKGILALQKERTTSGIDSALLLQQTIAQLAESESLLPVLEEIFVQTKNGIALLLGELPEEFCLLSRMPPSVPLVCKDSIDTGFPSELLRRRPDILKAERLLAAATERVGVAIADYFPKFNVLGTVTAESSNPAKWFTTGSLAWFIGATGRWPLVDFGRIAFNVTEKKSVEKQALLSYCRSVVSALKDVENALVAYSKEKERVSLLEKRLTAITKERDLQKELFDAGIANQSDYLLAERTRIIIEDLVTDAHRAYSFAVVAVYKALGGGWAEGEGSRWCANESGNKKILVNAQRPICIE